MSLISLTNIVSLWDTIKNYVIVILLVVTGLLSVTCFSISSSLGKKTEALIKEQTIRQSKEEQLNALRVQIEQDRKERDRREAILSAQLDQAQKDSQRYITNAIEIIRKGSKIKDECQPPGTLDLLRGYINDRQKQTPSQTPGNTSTTSN